MGYKKRRVGKAVAGYREMVKGEMWPTIRGELATR